MQDIKRLIYSAVFFLAIFCSTASIVCYPSGKDYYNVYFKLGESEISTQRYENIDLAVFEIFRTSLLKLPFFRNIMDEEFDINITLTIREKEGIFNSSIEIIHQNLKSSANLKKNSSVFYEMQKEFLEIVIEALKLKLTKEQYSSYINVSTRSLNALICYGNALYMMKTGESLEMFEMLSRGVIADGSFALQLSLYNNVFKNLERFFADSIKFSRLNKDNYMNLVDLYIIYGDFTRALQVIQEGKGIFGDIGEFNLKEGDLYYKAGNYSEAEKIYQNILRENPGDAGIANRLGQSYLKMKEYDRAIEMFSQVLRTRPASAQALWSISEAYQEKGDYKMALGKLRDLLRISSENYLVQNRIAYIYYLDEDFDRAVNILNSILSKEKNNIESLELLGDIYKSRKDHTKAVYYYSQTINYDPERVDVYDKLAQVYKRTGDKRLNEVYITLGNLYKRRNEYEKAKECFQKVYEIDRNDPLYYYEMGNLYFSLVDYEQAITYYEKAGSLGLDDPAMLKHMAVIYMFLNRLRLALESIQKGLEMDPGNIDFQFTIGKIYYFQKNYDMAMQVFKDIEDKMNDNYEYFYIKGIMLLDRLEFQKGMENLKKASMLNSQMKIDHAYVKTYLNINELINSLTYERGDEYNLIIAMPESGALNTLMLDLKGKKYDKNFFRGYLTALISGRLRIKSVENTLSYIENSNIDIYDPSFISTDSLSRFITSLKSDGMIFLDLRGEPVDDSENCQQGLINSAIYFYRRGMEGPVKFSIPLFAVYKKSVILMYTGIVFALLAGMAGSFWGYARYQAIKRGHGALRIRILFPPNRRIPMNVTLLPVKRIATLDMGEVLFTRLVVGNYQALFRGMLTRYDEIMGEEREIGDFRMKEPVNIRKNEISEIVLDFSKELYVEVYITRKNQYLEGAEVMVRELNITKFTNTNGYVSFIVPKMSFTFLVSHEDISIEKKYKIDDDNTTIFIEIDPLIKSAVHPRQSSGNIDFEYLD